MGSTKATQQDQEQELEPVRPELTEQTQEQPTPKYRFEVLANREARWSESAQWRDYPIGHAWIRLVDPAGNAASWGYWPDMTGGHTVDPAAPWKSVPGEVRHPDRSLQPEVSFDYEIEEDAAHKVARAANDKVAWAGMYNLFTYNCTTFALEMANVAGVSPPSAEVLGVMSPDVIHESIAAIKEKGGGDVAGGAAGREVDSETT